MVAPRPSSPPRDRRHGAVSPAVLAVGTIEQLLKDRAESLARELFPNARREGPRVHVGSLAGEAGDSLAIDVAGPKAGNWRDYCPGAGLRDRGDMLWLVACARCGGDLGQAVAWAKSWLGLDGLDPARIARVRIEAEAIARRRGADAAAAAARTVASARKRWHMGRPIAGTLAETYLRTRGVDFRPLGKAPGALRFNPSVQYGYGEGAVLLPAMVAQVNALSGEHVATHRTWLKRDGSGKAGAAEGIAGKAKKVLGSYAGAHIPVWKGASGSMSLRDIPAGTDVWVTEGIEDGCVAACADPSLRIVAGISLSNFAALALPPQMGWLVFLKQNDPPGSAADEAFQRAVAAQRAQGRRVKVAPPPAGAKDVTELAERALEGSEMEAAA